MGENLESQGEQASFYKDLALLREKSPNSRITKYLDSLSEDDLRILDEGLNQEGSSFYSLNVLEEDEEEKALELLRKALSEEDLSARRALIKQLP